MAGLAWPGSSLVGSVPLDRPAAWCSAAEPGRQQSVTDGQTAPTGTSTTTRISLSDSL